MTGQPEVPPTMQSDPTTVRRPQIQLAVALQRLALLLVVSLALAVLPVRLPELGTTSAWAQGAGNGGGRGGGGGNSGGPGNSGGWGGESAGGFGGGGFAAGGRRGSGGGDVGDAAAVRGGQPLGGVASRGPGSAGERGEPAGLGRAFVGLRDAVTRWGAAAAATASRGRYAGAGGWPDDENRPGGGLGRPAYTLDDRLTARLVARGWQAPAPADDTGFRNHGHRVSTMVEIAKHLGYGAHVGALQANFGGAHAATVDDAATRETLTGEIAALQDALGGLDDLPSDAARELEARLAELEGQLAALDGAEGAPTRWDGDWRTADLDVNGDGVVDLADLAAARALAGAHPGEPDAETPEAAQLEDGSEADTRLADVR